MRGRRRGAGVAADGHNSGSGRGVIPSGFGPGGMFDEIPTLAVGVKRGQYA